MNPVRKQLAAAPRGDNFTVSLPAHPALTPHAGCESRCPCFIFFYHLQELSSRPPPLCSGASSKPSLSWFPQICCSCAFPTADSSLQSPTRLGSWQEKGKEVLCVGIYRFLVLFDSLVLVGNTAYHFRTFWIMIAVSTDLERGKRCVFMQWYLSICPQILLCFFLLCLLLASSYPRTAAQSRLWGGLHSEFFARQLASSKVYFSCLDLSSWACCGQWWRKGQCGERGGKGDRPVVKCRSEAINAAFLQASLMWNDGCCCSWLQEPCFVCTISPCHKIPTAQSQS